MITSDTNLYILTSAIKIVTLHVTYLVIGLIFSIELLAYGQDKYCALEREENA